MPTPANPRLPLADRVTQWALGWTKAFGALTALASAAAGLVTVVTDRGDLVEVVQQVVRAVNELW